MRSFRNAAWTALRTAHSHLAQQHGLAWKYPADVAPFAAIAENTPAALEDLRRLMAPEEAVWLFHEMPPTV